MTGAAPDERWADALEEFETERDRPIRFSVQAGCALTTAWVGVLGGVLAVFDGRWWIIVVLAVGIVVTWTSWFVARRRGTLQPFLPVLWTSFLRRGERRSFRQVLLGRAAPSSPGRRALAEAIVDQQRTVTRAITWPLSGMVVTFLGLALSTGQWWLVWMWSAMIVLVGLATIVERVRSRRVERLIERDA